MSMEGRSRKRRIWMKTQRKGSVLDAARPRVNRGLGRRCRFILLHEAEAYRKRTVTKRSLVPLNSTTNDRQEPECQGLSGKWWQLELLGADPSCHTFGINRRDGVVEAKLG